jgi:ArsR family transcriptional regulator, arsenate/arsenite/antimonite-responsive transcriptional repressor
MLANRDCSQSEIVGAFYISQPAITKHLKILKEEGLIYETRSGRFCYYSLDHQRFEAAYCILKSEMEQILDHRLAHLKRYLENGEENQNGD